MQDEILIQTSPNSDSVEISLPERFRKELSIYLNAMAIYVVNDSYQSFLDNGDLNKSAKLTVELSNTDALQEAIVSFLAQRRIQPEAMRDNSAGNIRYVFERPEEIESFTAEEEAAIQTIHGATKLGFPLPHRFCVPNRLLKNGFILIQDSEYVIPDSAKWLIYQKGLVLKP